MIFNSYPARRLALKLSYDGTGYHGWQKQPDLNNTIQGELERVLSDFLKEEVNVDGASRTDAGVHAEDQLAAFTTKHPVRLNGLMKAINKRLSSQIAITQVYQVNHDFVPRFVNEGKRYRYRIYHASSRLPMIDRYATWLHFNLDTEALAQGLEYFRGEHDFQSFAASNGQHQTSTRHIWSVSLKRLPILPHGEVYEIHVEGNGFLKQMVRNIVGTLIEIGRGQWSPAIIPEILAAKNRNAAGPTAPAQGLCLEKMFWLPPN